jgi:hypothetical protein
MIDFVVATIGVPQQIKRLKRHIDEGEVAAERATISAAETLLKLANEICPIATGKLRDSGHVIVDGDGYNTVAAVIYDAEYAIYVHENLDAYHEPPTQAKWLEETLRTYRGDISEAIRTEVYEAFARAEGN